MLKIECLNCNTYIEVEAKTGSYRCDCGNLIKLEIFSKLGGDINEYR